MSLQQYISQAANQVIKIKPHQLQGKSPIQLGNNRCKEIFPDIILQYKQREIKLIINNSKSKYYEKVDDYRGYYKRNAYACTDFCKKR